MRLSGLRNTKVRSVDGEFLGRVHEIHCDGGKVVALTCGAGSFIERLTARKHGRRIRWEYVRKVARAEIVVAPGPPQRQAKKPSGPRSRKRTRQASGQRSKR